MVVINEKGNTLQIIISTPAPDEQRDAILKALCAAVRWHGTSTCIITNQNTDGENLLVLASLMESMIEAKTINS